MALAVRLAHLDSPPFYDEFYHLLAARQWLVDGTFRIVEGEYTRAAWFTRLVAGSLALFGDSVAAARVPAVIAGVLWTVTVFWWTWQLAGPIAGWAAGLVLALDAGAIHLSQSVRFYTLSGLLVWTGSVLAYALATAPFRATEAARRLGLAVLSFVAAAHLSDTAFIGLAAVALWAGTALAWRHREWLRAPHRPRHAALAATLAVAAALALGLAHTDTVAALRQRYMQPLYWMDPEADSPRWYAWWLGTRYPTLWTLFPAAAAVAIACFTRPALFALTIFGTGLLAVSFGPAKAERYLYFALPYFFLLWSLALATLLPALRRVLERTVEALGIAGLSPRARAMTVVSGLVVAIGFAAAQNDGLRLGARMVWPGERGRPYQQADWPAVLSHLRPVVDSAGVVLSSWVLKPLYYLGRGDMHLSWTETAEAGFKDGEPVEFARDRRTGLPTLSAPESLERVMACFASGVVLTEEFHLNRRHFIPEPTTALLLARAEEVVLPPGTRVRAFRWRQAGPAQGPECRFRTTSR